MKAKLLTNTKKTCVLIFLLLLLVHAIEAIVLRMDETVFAENFINKVFGIIVMAIVLKMLDWGWNDIGFSRKGPGKGILTGFSLAVVSFLIAFLAEIFILMKQGNHIRIGFFVTGFSLTGDTVINNGIGFILMCIFFNIINVIMEEGIFRGLFYGILRTDHSMKISILIQALFFGLWHVVTPLHNLIDGDMNYASFAGMSIGYIILAGLMGIKWGLLYRMTGNLYVGMTDHFCNNCIATNLLHVVTDNGIDELMIVRVLIAQMLSFFIVFVLWKKKRNDGAKS